MHGLDIMDGEDDVCLSQLWTLDRKKQVWARNKSPGIRRSASTPSSVSTVTAGLVCVDGMPALCWASLTFCHSQGAVHVLSRGDQKNYFYSFAL